MSGLLMLLLIAPEMCLKASLVQVVLSCFKVFPVEKVIKYSNAAVKEKCWGQSELPCLLNSPVPCCATRGAGL